MRRVECKTNERRNERVQCIDVAADSVSKSSLGEQRGMAYDVKWFDKYENKRFFVIRVYSIRV